MAPEPVVDREDREDAPFLAPETQAESASTPSHGETKPSHLSDSNASASKITFRLKLILFAMVLGVEIGFSFLEGPMVRILESIACRQYYIVADPTKIGADGQVPEDLCKISEIQAELAAVKGYHMFFEGLICMIGWR